MDGIVNVEAIRGGQADLVTSIAKVGFNETPLFSMIQKAVPSVKNKAVLGHEWQYEKIDDADDENAHAEGSAPATATSNQLQTSKNHYQIMKDTYGVSGSVESSVTTEGQKELKRQGVIKLKKQRKTIENALFKSQAPTQRNATNGVKGKFGGIGYWATAENTVDGAGATLTMAKLKEMLKIGWKNGVPVTHIFCSDIQKDIIDDLLESKVRVNQGGTVLKMANYTEIKNLSYAPQVRIILSAYMQSDEIFGVNMESLALVYDRLTKTYDLPRTKDAVEKEIITELTLRVNNPYAVTKLSALGV